MNPKVAVILVLVLIGLLFAGGVVAGGLQDDPEYDAEDGPPPFAAGSPVHPGRGPAPRAAMEAAPRSVLSFS